MTEHTKTQFEAIAQSLTFPEFTIINGDRKAAINGTSYETHNPATNNFLANLPHCGSEDIDLAVIAAQRSFQDGVWARISPETRKETLLKLADIIRRETTTLAVMESLESGKPISDCLHEIGTEVPNIFQWYAELIDKSYDRIAPTDDSTTALILKEPIGVVGVVLPWNFPLLMAAWKLAPALASGCSIVVKPAEETALTTIRLGELALEAGLPPGVLNVVTGPGETTGRLIGQHSGIDAVTFTGSTDVGRLFLQYSATSNLKTVGLEMGGKSPLIILDDAEITNELIDDAVNAAFWNAGQNCSANMRQIIARTRQDEFIDRLTDRVKKIRIGNPLDPLTEMGPMISAAHRNSVLRYVKKGVEQGATQILSPEDFSLPTLGNYLAPSIFGDVTAKMEIAEEEIFGPVLGVLPVDSHEEALALANNTEYGLHATVFTKDIDLAFHFARRLACGTVAVNGFSEGDIKTPFGGYRKSGSLARDNGVEAMAQYQQIKTIWITHQGIHP